MAAVEPVKHVGLTPFQNNLLALIDSVIGYTTNDAVNVTKAIADHPEILLGLIGEALAEREEARWPTD